MGYKVFIKETQNTFKLIKMLKKLFNIIFLSKNYSEDFNLIKYRIYKYITSGKNKFHNIDNNLRSESDNGRYLNVVSQALKSQYVFNNFKMDPDYKEIVETISESQGKEFLDAIQKNNPEILNLIDEFSENDLIGNPLKFYYSEINKFVNPTTLRYINVASDLKNIFGNIGENIVEVGCGYGGQCLILDRIFSIKNYQLMDMPEVNQLIKKYLDNHLLNLNYKFKTINDCGEEYFDLAISNYAFSELAPQVQKEYLEKVLTKSKRGYLTMNSGTDSSVFKNHLDLNEIRKYIKNLEIIDEEPLSYDGNYIIIWK